MDQKVPLLYYDYFLKNIFILNKAMIEKKKCYNVSNLSEILKNFKKSGVT